MGIQKSIQRVQLVIRQSLSGDNYGNSKPFHWINETNPEQESQLTLCFAAACEKISLTVEEPKIELKAYTHATDPSNGTMSSQPHSDEPKAKLLYKYPLWS